MFNALMIGSGIFWTATYLLIIRQGFKDQTYGMPLVALCANLSWEFIFAVLHPHGFPQVAVNYIWLSFDLFIAWQVIWFGPQEWKLPRTSFLIVFFVTFGAAFFGVLLVSHEFWDMDKGSGAYAAFGQNLMMSVLFIEMYRNRSNLSGQSLWIAVCKLLGTLLASVAFYAMTSLGKSNLMVYLFVSIFLFDIMYVALIYQRKGRHDRTPKLDSFNV